ncbi:MAG: glycosyltransferase family 39 protein, partial [Actinobacteria bacterium]|nr:glycosyltransferase family 39 protein [Actinomycetota bacterium]
MITIKGNKRNFLVFIIPILILIVLTIGLIYTRAPWSDESWLASSAVNLIRNGFMGNTNIIADGTWLEGINQYTFWQPPLYFLAEAAFLKVFDVGLFQVRFLNLFWALISIGAIYYILRKITNNKIIIFLSLLVLSVDKNFLEASSGGRMDLMAVSFSLISYAVYLNIREKNLSMAIFLGNLFVCLSGLTHGNGILGFCGLLFI